ncbi:MAG: hypothetical protein ABIG66_01295 [Candidatus Kerfeldbacteria bacterium]
MLDTKFTSTGTEDNPKNWQVRKMAMARAFLKELRDNGLTDEQILDIADLLRVLGSKEMSEARLTEVEHASER